MIQRFGEAFDLEFDLLEDIVAILISTKEVDELRIMYSSYRRENFRQWNIVQVRKCLVHGQHVSLGTRGSISSSCLGDRCRTSKRTGPRPTKPGCRPTEQRNHASLPKLLHSRQPRQATYALYIARRPRVTLEEEQVSLQRSELIHLLDESRRVLRDQRVRGEELIDLVQEVRRNLAVAEVVQELHVRAASEASEGSLAGGCQY